VDEEEEQQHGGKWGVCRRRVLGKAVREEQEGQEKERGEGREGAWVEGEEKEEEDTKTRASRAPAPQWAREERVGRGWGEDGARARRDRGSGLAGRMAMW